MMILVFMLAVQCSEIMRRWSEVDKAMSCYRIVPKSVKLKLKIITIFLMLMAFSNRIRLLYIQCNDKAISAEHVSLVAAVAAKMETSELGEFIRSYTEDIYHPLSKVVQYNIVTGVTIIVGLYKTSIQTKLYTNFQVLDIYLIFTWYFSEILIISVSILLTAKFNQISERIKLLLQHKVMLRPYFVSILTAYFYPEVIFP